MPKIYIIIVNFCGAQDTIACLESLYKLLYNNYQIIVVDNCSTDNSVSIIEGWASGYIRSEEYNEELKFLVEPNTTKPIDYLIFNEDDIRLQEKQSVKKDLIIIKANSNRGFSAGNNIGLLYAISQNDSSYYWLLNNDTLVIPSSLYELVGFHQQCQKSSKVGIVGGKLIYYNEPNIIQCLGGGTYNELFGFISQVGDGMQIKSKSIQRKYKVDYISGACMLVNSNFVEEVGLLAEDYFLYYEELDWCTRGRKKGWDINYTEKAIIYHKVGSTINVNQKGRAKSEISDYYSVRSKLLYASKYNSFFTNVVVRLSLFGSVLNRIFRGQFKRVFTIIKLSFSKY